VSEELHGTEGLFTKIFQRHSKRIISVGAVILAALIAVVSFMIVDASPRSIEVQLNIDDVYGGAFDSSCTPSSDAQEIKLKDLKVVTNGTKDSIESPQQPLRLGSIQGKCVLSAVYTLSPNEKYSVSYLGTSLGVLNPREVEEGVKNFNYSLKFTKSLVVQVDLYSTYDSCSGTVNDYQCSYISTQDLQSCDYVGTDLIGCRYTNLFTSNWPIYSDNESDFCQGQNGLAHINPDSKITVSGLSNGQSKTLPLGNGTSSLFSIESKVLDCKMTVDFTDFPYDSLGYQLDVAGDYQSDYFTDYLRSSDWTLSMWYGDKP